MSKENTKKKKCVFRNNKICLLLSHSSTAAGITADITRFTLNSTLGIGGLIDVASGLGLDKNDEDFGQTLAVWGVSDGPYLVLPGLGPSTMRDTLAMIPDAFLK